MIAQTWAEQGKQQKTSQSGKGKGHEASNLNEKL